MSESDTLPPTRIMFVDDEPSILSALKRLFRSEGYTIFTAGGGADALAQLETQPIDLVVSDMRMPEMDGAQLLEQVCLRWPQTARILLTGYADVASTVAAINRGEIWRYVSKPWDDDDIRQVVKETLKRVRLQSENLRLTALTNRQNEELKELNAGLEQKVAARTAELAAALSTVKTAHEKLRQGFVATVHAFSSVIEAREGRLAGHSRRVADLARRMAERLGHPDTEQQDIMLAGLLHDIGKIGLPDAMLGRSFNALSPAERTLTMTHPVKGQQLLSGVEQLANAARLIRSHHELMDGSGYPDQLTGLAIPPGARILAVANDFDALQMGALALHPHSPREAQEYIIKQRGRRYDPMVVDALISLLTEPTTKTEPELMVDAASLRPGMLLTRNLLHSNGQVLFEHGRVVDADTITRLQQLEQAEGQPLKIHIRHGAGPSTLRDKPEAAAPRLFKEIALSTARLKEGMTLSRNLNHREGYLLLARNYVLNDTVIHQLKDIETSDGHPITVHIRIEDR